jgi:hypothetical protein
MRYNCELDAMKNPRKSISNDTVISTYCVWCTCVNNIWSGNICCRTKLFKGHQAPTSDILMGRHFTSPRVNMDCSTTFPLIFVILLKEPFHEILVCITSFKIDGNTIYTKLTPLFLGVVLPSWKFFYTIFILIFDFLKVS